MSRIISHAVGLILLMIISAQANFPEHNNRARQWINYWPNIRPIKPIQPMNTNVGPVKPIPTINFNYPVYQPLNFPVNHPIAVKLRPGAGGSGASSGGSVSGTNIGISGTSISSGSNINGQPPQSYDYLNSYFRG